MWEFNTKAVGVTFDNRQDVVQRLKVGFRIFWKHEKDNEYDENAIALFADPNCTDSIGHLKREVAKNFVKRIKALTTQEIFVEQVTGGEGSKVFGVNLKVVVHGEKGE